ncbi:MAG TPA: hypothetical protein VKJ47_24025 [Candidatus Binatia bacterium]|nr:hypothetical protein [Candidatus Binatia bacterium]
MALKKERWTLTFDRRLKHAVIAEARRRGVYPARILEEAVREKFNPFGHPDVIDPTAYVRTLRRKSRKMADEEFLSDLKRWEKVTF